MQWLRVAVRQRLDKRSNGCITTNLVRMRTICHLVNLAMITMIPVMKCHMKKWRNSFLANMAQPVKKEIMLKEVKVTNP